MKGGAITINVNPATGVVSTESYVAPDNSSATAILNATTQSVSSLQINETNGTSQLDNYTYNSDGSVVTNGTGFSGSNETGNQLYVQTDTIYSGAVVKATISGNGDNASLNNVMVTVAANTTASLTGANNTITLGNNDTLSIVNNPTGATIETIAASEANVDLTTDSLIFEGHLIAGNVNLGGKDTFGRTYTLSGTTLTVAGATAGDSLTINNFTNGSFGLNVSVGHKILFGVVDTIHPPVFTYTTQLWVTDGTAAGTQQLTSNINYNDTTAFSPDITAFGNNNALFARNGLEITDGTVAGTKNLNASVTPSNITVLGNKALFQSGSALWITDGTTAGTYKIFSAEIINSDITIFGNKALFNADNALWITNGTTQGTYEVTSSSPVEISSFGTKALFLVRNTVGNGEIWVTDGTTTGTQKLTNTNLNSSVSGGITNLGNKAVFNEGGRLWVTDGTVAGTQLVGANVKLLTGDNMTRFGNKALFEGVDTKGNFELWITDGTTSGTQELTTTTYPVVSNENPGGNPSRITVVGNKALFIANDSKGINGLWVTDGTTAGTREIVPNIDVRNGITALSDNRALFSAVSFSSNTTTLELWVTDGTTAGTQKVTSSINSLDPNAIEVIDQTAFGVATDTITSHLLYGSSGNDTIANDASNETLIGNGGYDTYKFAKGNGADVIQNGVASSNVANGELDFGTGIATNQLWFIHSGNDLRINVLGSADSMTVAGWYSNNYSQLKEIKTADGSMIDSHLANLVQAMATFSSLHSAFNPVTATQFPTDSTLQTTLAAAWHH